MLCPIVKIPKIVNFLNQQKYSCCLRLERSRLCVCLCSNLFTCASDTFSTCTTVCEMRSMCTTVHVCEIVNVYDLRKQTVTSYATTNTYIPILFVLDHVSSLFLFSLIWFAVVSSDYKLVFRSVPSRTICRLRTKQTRTSQ